MYRHEDQTGTCTTIVSVREVEMPYRDISELPESVRDNLPQQAQEMYLAA